MNISQLHSVSPLPNNHPLNPHAAVTEEQAAAFEANLDAPSETARENFSQGQQSLYAESPDLSHFPISH